MTLSRKLTPKPHTPAIVSTRSVAATMGLSLTLGALVGAGCAMVGGPAPTCGPCCHDPMGAECQRMRDSGVNTDVPSQPSADGSASDAAGADASGG
jgi:hypothetical protein